MFSACVHKEGEKSTIPEMLETTDTYSSATLAVKIQLKDGIVTKPQVVLETVSMGVPLILGRSGLTQNLKSCPWKLN